MANAEMHAIQVQDTPVLLQAALTPGLKLVGEALVEATDRTSTGSHSQQGLSDFPNGCRVLVPATNICASPSTMCGASRLLRSNAWLWN